MTKIDSLTVEQQADLAKLLYYSKKALRYLENKNVQFKEWDHLDHTTREEWVDEVRWFLQTRPQDGEVIFYRRQAYMEEQGWAYGPIFDPEKKRSPNLVKNYSDLAPASKLELDLFHSTCTNYLKFVERISSSSEGRTEDIIRDDR